MGFDGGYDIRLSSFMIAAIKLLLCRIAHNIWDIGLDTHGMGWLT